MIFVSLGSQKFPMDRVPHELDRLIEEGVIIDQVIGQLGHCTYRPKHFEAQAFYDKPVLQDLITRCDVLLCHGGTSSIINGLKLGKPVVVVPRLVRYGEHVDDHQRELAACFSNQGHIIEVHEMEDLARVLDQARNFVPKPYEPHTGAFAKNLMNAIDALLVDGTRGTSDPKGVGLS